MLCRRTIGNKTVSRIDSPVSAINNLSRPIPVPVVGGIPYSSAARKSSSSSHCLVVSGRSGACLGSESFPLHDRVDEFGISGREFDTADVQIPLLGDAGNAAVSAGEWGGLGGEVADESRRPEPVADGVLPELFDHFPVPIATVTGYLDT